MISVGAANAYGHRGGYARAALPERRIYRTDFFGTVRCRVRAGKFGITQATENV
ncbi:MAG: hypothetical protein ACLRSW_16630 [Christensenellaceae bacterium]